MIATTAIHRSPWPVAIITFFIFIITTIVFFITWAVRQEVDLVRKNYYAHEIEFQSHLDKINRAASLTSPASITYQPATRRLRVLLPPEHQPVSGRIELYRPSNARLDKTIRLDPAVDGSQQIDTSHLADGLWKVRLNWLFKDVDYFKEEIIVMGGGNH